MLFFWGLCEQQRYHFFFLILIYTDKHSTFLRGLYSVRKQDDMSSLI